ncbi:MAG: hypothetical protein ACQEXJ_11210 [Myxococcota bacterium]
MRRIGTILVILGVGLAAASGARNTDELVERQRVEGRKALAPEEEAGDLEVPQVAEPTSRLAAWFEANGLPFVAGLLLVGAGAMVFRRAERHAMGADLKPSGGGHGGPLDLSEALERLAGDLLGLRDDLGADAGDTEALKARMEALQLDQLDPIVEARHQVQIQYGVAGMAALMGPLSYGERYLNRAWSALVDGFPEEATASLTQAAEGVAEARDALGRLMAG